MKDSSTETGSRMCKNQCFLSILPSKRQFTLVLLFEIPSGSLIEYGVQKTSGKNNSCFKKEGERSTLVSLSGLWWEKPKGKGLFTCGKVNKTAFPQDGNGFHKSVGPCHVLPVGKASVLVWNSTSFSFIISTLTNDSPFCIRGNWSCKCSEGSTSPMKLASTVPFSKGLYSHFHPTFRFQMRTNLVPTRAADMLSCRCYQNNITYSFWHQ